MGWTTMTGLTSVTFLYTFLCLLTRFVFLDDQYGIITSRFLSHVCVDVDIYTYIVPNRTMLDVDIVRKTTLIRQMNVHFAMNLEMGASSFYFF